MGHLSWNQTFGLLATSSKTVKRFHVLFHTHLWDLNQLWIAQFDSHKNLKSESLYLIMPNHLAAIHVNSNPSQKRKTTHFPALFWKMFGTRRSQ